MCFDLMLVFTFWLRLWGALGAPGRSPSGNLDTPCGIVVVHRGKAAQQMTKYDVSR